MNASTFKPPAKKFSLSIGAIISIIFHVGLALVLLYLVVPEKALDIIKKKQPVVEIIPPPPPPPPPPPKIVPPEPPKIVPKPTPTPPRPTPPPPVQTTAPADSPAPSVPPSPPPTPPVPPAPPAPPAPAVSRLISQTAFNELNGLVAKNFVYPARSKVNEEEGRAILRVLIARDGSILSVEVVKSSGYPELDRAAKESVLKSRKISPIPADISPGTPQFTADLPVDMKLE